VNRFNLGDTLAAAVCQVHSAIIHTIQGSVLSFVPAPPAVVVVATAAAAAAAGAAVLAVHRYRRKRLQSPRCRSQPPATLAGDRPRTVRTRSCTVGRQRGTRRRTPRAAPRHRAEP
jgi:membrane protein implicated in regulation of membrane protease activity